MRKPILVYLILSTHLSAFSYAATFQEFKESLRYQFQMKRNVSTQTFKGIAPNTGTSCSMDVQFNAESIQLITKNHQNINVRSIRFSNDQELIIDRDWLGRYWSHSGCNGDDECPNGTYQLLEFKGVSLVNGLRTVILSLSSSWATEDNKHDCKIQIYYEFL